MRTPAADVGGDVRPGAAARPGRQERGPHRRRGADGTWSAEQLQDLGNGTTWRHLAALAEPHVTQL